MNDIPINTEKNEKSKPINNVYLYTDLHGQNKSELNYNSINYDQERRKISSRKNYKKYTINLDWLQFVTKKTIEINFAGYQSPNLIVTENNSHNPNFYKCYVVSLLGTEICELHTIPTNMNYSKDEVVVKVKNNLLYHNGYLSSIHLIMKELGLEFVRISRIDIALDGIDNLKINDYIKRYTRTDTIQINNDKLKIDGIGFDKKAVKFDTYSIGRKKYQKVAKAYNKTQEIDESQKDYISKYWELNDLNTEKDVGRFEIQLGNRHLKKYEINNLCKLSDISFIGSIFKNEVENWFKMYQVKKKDIKAHRKDIAIKKGKQLPLFKWKHIPHESLGLSLKEVQPNLEHQAKRSVSFNLTDLIDNFPNNESTSGNTVSNIQSVTINYDLEKFTAKKINEKLARATHIDRQTKLFISKELNKSTHLQRLQLE